MLDTNACIGMIQGRIPRFGGHDPLDCVISPIVAGELYNGANKSEQVQRNRQKAAELIGAVTMPAITQGVALLYGEIRAALEKQGQVIGPNDLWISAHAKHLGCILVTNNQREFRRVPGLSLEDWT